MKKAWIQTAVGFFPILMGFCSRLVFLLPLPLVINSLLFIALWLWLCFRFSDPELPVFPQILRLCFPGILVIGLALWNEMMPGSILSDFLVSASNFYFFSGLAIAGRIVTQLLHVVTAWPYYIVSCFLLTLLASLTVILKRKLA